MSLIPGRQLIFLAGHNSICPGHINRNYRDTVAYQAFYDLSRVRIPYFFLRVSPISICRRILFVFIEIYDFVFYFDAIEFGFVCRVCYISLFWNIVLIIADQWNDRGVFLILCLTVMNLELTFSCSFLMGISRGSRRQWRIVGSIPRCAGCRDTYTDT